MRGGTLTSELKMQLITVHAALNSCKQSHYAIFGTLIGVLRDHGMNPAENDNDIGLFEPLRASCVRELRDRGMVVFESVVTRVCRKCTARCARGPNDVFAYNDLYSIEWVRRYIQRVLWYRPNKFKMNETMYYVPLFDGYILVPGNAEAVLHHVYGDWRTPSSMHEPLLLRTEVQVALLAPAVLIVLALIRMRRRSSRVLLPILH